MEQGWNIRVMSEVCEYEYEPYDEYTSFIACDLEKGHEGDHSFTVT